ncbi:hypothetical protein CAEBREN_08768 [Caenorhabditis brenneri]|uniref:BTB domain-containing protein n=1 Tax=Caenorhabditis brenneri TaxID=135651 RepID=G0MVX8_CAEBE|nr:hypothetical protein CAEBREN_08768 [Caenorhabditis brenneri]
MTKTPKLSLHEKAFAKSDKKDAILVVEEKKLHVNKALLSIHSDYFNTLFNSDFKEKSMEEIEIKDVEFKDFATLLSLIHPRPFEITKGNAENLLKLADRFLLSAAKFHVELFIKTTSEFSRYEKLMLADKYNLKNLLKHVIGLYGERESFKDFWHISDRNFSDSLKVKIFDILFNRHGNFFLNWK